jgi:DNA replication protein DnaC
MRLKVLPQKSGEILLEIIMRHYENRSTIMTSNRPIEEWSKLLSDVPEDYGFNLLTSFWIDRFLLLGVSRQSKANCQPY